MEAPSLSGSLKLREHVWEWGGVLVPGTSLRLEVTLLAACLRGQRPESESLSWLCLRSMWIKALLVTMRFLKTQIGNCGIWLDWKYSGVNVDILGIRELKWTGMGEFNSDDHYIYYCGQESLRRNRVAIMVNKRVRNAVLGCNLKNDRMISVRFQGKPFNITVIQVYAPTIMLKKLKLNGSMKTYKTF